MTALLERLKGLVGASAAAAPEPAPEPSGSAEPLDRRRRDALPAGRELVDRVGQKVLHGWLENRHQTLMPLSANLARLDPSDLGHLVRFAAVSARAAGHDRAPDAMAAWLGSAGADADAQTGFRSALKAPLPLDAALAAVARPELAALAYVTAIVAGRGAGPAGRAFADYVAARLALPTTAIRSAERRFGG